MVSEPGISDGASDVPAVWLRQALAAGGVTDLPQLEHAAIERIRSGVGLFGEILRCRLTWPRDFRSVPQSVIVKLPSAEPRTFRAARRFSLYRNEWNFYRYAASVCPVKSPKLLYGEFDANHHRFVLVLEELGEWSIGVDSLTATESEARIAARVITRLHGKFWDKGEPIDGTKFPDYLRERRRLLQLAYLVYLPPTLDRFGHLFSNNTRMLAEAYRPRIAEHMADLAAGHTTFTHGDYRISNTFLGGKGEGDCVAIDWQNCRTHTGMRDVSYLLTSSVFPESRRKIERDVVEEYHDAVSSMGVSDYGLGECWRDYRRAMLSCLIGPVLTIGALDWSQSRAYE